MFQRRLVIAVVLWTAAFGQQKKILVLNGSPEMLRTLDPPPTVRLVSVNHESAARELPDADAFIGEIQPAEVRAGTNLKWVQVISAGVERVLHLSGSNDLRDSKIVLTNNQVVQGPEIADHAMAMLLMFSRRLNVYAANQRREQWRGGGFEGIELNGKTAVVIGVGGIGTQIAVRAAAFGMNVIGVDPQSKPFQPYLKKVVKPDQLDEVLPEADVVFVSAPHTPQSHKMMGPRQFELMKANSYFVAVSRGGLYDMNALVKALDSRRLAGAGVDVTDPEPLPPGHPLWKFENAIVTPHVAGQSDKSMGRMLGTVRENIRRFADGRPLINVVDKQRGY
jgi:phosphoglycerate dehydrogenase-like enzyme